MKVLRKVAAGIGALLLTAVAVTVPVMSLSTPAASVDAAAPTGANTQAHDDTHSPQSVSVIGRV
jgi:hypothetical protein